MEMCWKCSKAFCRQDFQNKRYIILIIFTGIKVSPYYIVLYNSPMMVTHSDVLLFCST